MSLPGHLSTRGVNMEWIADLEMIEVCDPPLPLAGAAARRTWDADSRLVLPSAKDSDRVLYYERHGGIRHRKTGAIYVLFRETMDALLARQKDPDRYPKWLMDHPVKQAERQYFLARAVDNPRTLMARLSNDAMWMELWLKDLPDGWELDCLIYYIMKLNPAIKQEFFGRR